MVDWVSTTISILGLAASGFGVWYANSHRGKIKITGPNVIDFVCDSGKPGEQAPEEKIVIGTTISSTGKRGRIIEALSVIVSGAGKIQTFDRWCMEEAGEVIPANGLPIPADGINARHHFYLQESLDIVGLVPGEYELEVRAYVQGLKAPMSLKKVKLSVPKDHLLETQPLHYRARFNWRPHTPIYFANVQPLKTVSSVIEAK